ncbi:MAG: adenine deaminase [Chloroflexi bacterium GWB2_49_20]|nr:MAG: adenine deaminase [Chloroflexi bacterium GWB2_49_20]OGN77650.1 MAG: adenine deaminase [Chloroflexi bacterium GWC2_49_37]OGN86426.1 MAG: adenine deaminase [Chloroflexi bacterium GWD2_49_16]HBG74665.1 adenine deaminase [Anaerolineae bacterium]
MKSSQTQTRNLIDVAMGRLPADLVIRDGIWVCVQTGEFIKNTDIAIKDGQIAFIGADALHCIGKETKVIKAHGRYLVPGLLDAHMHVESGMLSVTEFVRAVIPHGTTGMFIDPHEIANVFGLDGVRLMVDEAKLQPIHVWVQIPSCVPSSPDFETSGASLSSQEVGQALTWEGVIGLGEVMDYLGVANGDEKMLTELAAARQAGKVIGGHYASTDLGYPFHGYLAGGAEDDHEGTTLEGAVERARQGMKVMLRYGSAWQDVIEQVKAITVKGLDSRHFILCTDDSHAGTLHLDGHMDRVLRHAIQQGLKPMTAIQMATINTAEHFGLGREIGMLAPGRWADVVFVEDLNNFRAALVIARGVVAAEVGKLLLKQPDISMPDWVTNSVHLSHLLTVDSFKLKVDGTLKSKNVLTANVIGIVENQAVTRHMKMDVNLNSDEVHSDLKNDIAKVALVDRHRATKEIQMGLVHGFGFDKSCAVATTVSHDSHQLIVIGTDDACMAMAANKLHEVGGGQVVVREQQVIGLVELPIAGLMSSESAPVVAAKVASILNGFKDCGCRLNNPNMQLSLLALVVIPELRLSDRGLVEVNNMKVLPVLEG